MLAMSVRMNKIQQLSFMAAFCHIIALHYGPLGSRLGLGLGFGLGLGLGVGVGLGVGLGLEGGVRVRVGCKDSVGVQS